MRGGRRAHLRTIRVWAIPVHRGCDLLTGVLLYCLVVFSPWALGSTQGWSVWTMNIGGYVLGGLFLIKLGVRWFGGYRAPRWEAAVFDSSEHVRRAMRLGQASMLLLAVFSVLLLGYCLISALNARATFDGRTLTFTYHQCVGWLPHSLDSAGSWSAFWMYLGLAGFLWALRDWLLGKSGGEERAEWQKVGPLEARGGAPLPERLRSLLWVLAISGGLLGCEAILQRALDSPRLLFVVKPRVHQTAEGQFGPYAYRSNAAQYFNLLWPVCVGFWWTLNRNAGAHRKRHHWLLAVAAVTAASPIISTSRAGAIITGGMALTSAALLGLMHWSDGAERRRSRAGMLTVRALSLFFCSALVLGFVFGWDALKPRLSELGEGLMDREQMSAEARPMARDYPWFGTGPGTFEMVSQLYSHRQVWWAQLHNDWLETRITFGWSGSVLIGGALVCVFLRWFFPGGIHGGRRFVGLTWVALAGCLLHARFDFPFQIHSTLLLFLLWCAMLSVLSRRTRF